MRRYALLLAVLATVVVPAGAQVQTTFETVTFTNAATGFTASTLAPNGNQGPVMTRCYGKLETAQIRYRVDGTSPVAGTGVLVDVGDILTVSGRAQLLAFEGIRTGATNGVINFSCDRYR
jgi:Flp pilus assembly pilin Flp